MNIIDVYSRAEGVAGKLSNFRNRPFVLDDVRCGGIEGFLQSLKFSDVYEQETVAALHGYHAFKTGQGANVWKESQVLYWRGVPLARGGPEYQELLTRAFDAQYEQALMLRRYLLATVGSQLRHTMGKSDPTDTTLTELEYIDQLNRLRFRALEEASAGT